MIDIGDSQSFKEPSEEVRLVLVRIVSKLIEKSILSNNEKKEEVDHLKLHVDQILSVLRSTLLDNFSDVKELSCECVQLLCRALPLSIHLSGPSSLIEPLTKTVSHQQKKIRIASIKAIGETSLTQFFYLV